MINILKNGIVTNSGPDQEWLDKHIAMESFGKAAHSYEQEISPAVLAEDGTEISPAQFETVNVPAEYTVEYIDNSAQLEQERVNAEALAFLAATDFYIIREQETGTICPQEVKAARAEARAKVVHGKA